VKLDVPSLDRQFGLPVMKDGCGVFGMLRKIDAPKIPGAAATYGISCVKYRGSNLGAGYAAFENNPIYDGQGRQQRPSYKIQAFVTGDAVAERMREVLEKEVGVVRDARTRRIGDGGQRLAVWEAQLLADDANSDSLLEKAVDSINRALFKDEFMGRIFSYGRYLSVYKEVGFPTEVAKMWGIDKAPGTEADMWIAHTRQPTNSPGNLPIWSHPFASMNTAIVHNGDISSYGSNMELLNTWGLRSHVGTDSEVIARLLDHLLRVRRLSVVEAATVLTNPFERNVSDETKELLYRYRGARLDGPFAVVAGYADGDDVYLIALTDRFKFRPLLVGEDDDCFYLASEENQIRNQSPRARIWTPEPGAFFIASLKKGIIAAGTTRDPAIQASALSAPSQMGDAADIRRVDAAGREFDEINREIASAISKGERGIAIEGCSGQRYLGIGASTRGAGRGERFEIRISGFPGNCLANLNEDARFEVFGNVADDLADAMHDGSVVVHGNARDVVGQALQGGEIFIRGTVGNRAGIQMREYRDERPFLIVGESADDYLGEYMAGGVVVVLNISESARPARNYIGTGMVGGRIYIRGTVDEEQVGLLPHREDVLHYLHSQTFDGTISMEAYEKVAGARYPSMSLISNLLPKEVVSRVLTLFFATKYMKPVSVERRLLDEHDLALIGGRVREFFRTFGLPEEMLTRVLSSSYTILSVKEERPTGNVPPQEIPVEE
jgi:glutamate synthase domain-containing protein 1/glutamate synthase domain-containing protein 3